MLVLMLFCALAAPPAPAHGVRVFISFDMEGVAGVVTGDQHSATGFEYARFREMATNEVLAVIEGARAAGATEFVVADGHGNGESLLVEKFGADTQIVRSYPRAHGMMEGIDGSFTAVFLVGYHASATSTAGVRAHTFSSATFADVKIGGVSASEAMVNAAQAGAFGVPVVMVSGDDAAVAEARRTLGDIEGAVVKWSSGFHTTRTLTPGAACALLRERAKQGMVRARAIKPFRVKAPVELELDFKNYRPVDVLAYLPIVERVSARAVRFRGRDLAEAVKFIQFVLNYQADLAP
jgi:D-amino peptidase